jgi:TetR/AcrR family transcriptional regulator, repressor for uid operon
MRKADPELQSRRRAEILAAAELCFLKRGFHQSSMQNIAAAAGVSMGLLYRYFANKDAIIEAAAAQDQEDSLFAIAALPDTGDVTAAWAALITAMAAQAAAPAYASLGSEIIAESNRSPKIRAILETNDAALVIAIMQKLKVQQRTKAINMPDTAANTAQALLMIFEGLTMRHFLAASSAQHDVIAERLVAHLLNA